MEQNRDAIDADADSPVDADPNWTGNHLSPFERLWLCLFGQLAMLCVDDRPPVRKSACQTLFQTINTYGHVLTQQAWEPVVWKVSMALFSIVFARYARLDTTFSCLAHALPHGNSHARRRTLAAKPNTCSCIAFSCSKACGEGFESKDVLIGAISHVERGPGSIRECC